MTTHIFLDADGVITNFDKKLMQIMGIYPPDSQLREKLETQSFVDTFPADKRAEIFDIISQNGFSFWETMELLPWACELVNFLKDKKGCKVFFCTSQGKFFHAPTGKMRFFNRWFPKIPLVITHEKYVCADSRSLLIDDSPDKIREFENHGGHVFLFPRQEMIMKTYGAIDQIKRSLNEIITQIQWR